MFFEWLLTKEARQALEALRALEKYAASNFNATRGLVIVKGDVVAFIKGNDFLLTEEVIGGKSPAELLLTITVNTCTLKLKTGDFHTISGRLSFGGIALRSLWKLCMDCLCNLGIYSEEDVLSEVQSFSDEITAIGLLVAGNGRSPR